MFKSIKKTKGFTLIELMIVVSLVGILAALAIQNFLLYQAKTKQSEAKSNLGVIFMSQVGYFGEHDTFASTVSDLDWVPVGTTRYAYSVIAGDATHFTARATANIDSDITIDVWEINEDKDLRSVTNDVLN